MGLSVDERGVVSVPPMPIAAPELRVARGSAIRTLLIGTGPRAVRCARDLERDRPRRALVGVLDSDAQPDLKRHAPEIPWLGPVDDLGKIVRRHCVDEIFVALPMRSRFDDLLSAWAAARELGVRISADFDLPHEDEWTVAAVRRDSLRVSWRRHPAMRFPGRPVKRFLDLVGASVALLVLSPLLVVVAIAVALDSRGPVFFRQVRIGRGGLPFRMLKFRTMVANAEELREELQHRNDATGISFKIFDDPRVTRLGRWLRRTSIDELPQLLNVLVGEMSLVGPRPLPDWIAAQLDDLASHRRLCVMPGVTGLWQVKGRQQDFDTMARLDLEYVDRWSLGLDLRILASTLPAIVRGDNAY